MSGLAPEPTMMRSTGTRSPRVRCISRAISSRNATTPCELQYLVRPSSMARLPAARIFTGVSKQGSPISRCTTSKPRDSRAWARARTTNAESVDRRSIFRDILAEEEVCSGRCIVRNCARMRDQFFGRLTSQQLSIVTGRRVASQCAPVAGCVQCKLVQCDEPRAVPRFRRRG